jgi:hypothetical protein
MKPGLVNTGKETCGAPSYEFVVAVWDGHERLGSFAIMNFPTSHHPPELIVAIIRHTREKKK